VVVSREIGAAGLDGTIKAERPFSGSGQVGVNPIIGVTKSS
jgi:hypothetical protein